MVETMDKKLLGKQFNVTKHYLHTWPSDVNIFFFLVCEHRRNDAIKVTLYSPPQFVRIINVMFRGGSLCLNPDGIVAVDERGDIRKETRMRW